MWIDFVACRVWRRHLVVSTLASDRDRGRSSGSEELGLCGVDENESSYIRRELPRDSERDRYVGVDVILTSVGISRRLGVTKESLGKPFG